MSSKRKNKNTNKSKKNKSESEEEVVESESYESSEEDTKLADKHFAKLKKEIVIWLDHDDKIKELNVKMKEHKDEKKEKELLIMEMISKLGVDDEPMNIRGGNGQLRGKVCRQKSVTKGALKDEIIKNALMEAIRDEKKVDQLVKKIESKRPVTERYYLKRTKGSKD